MDCSNGGELADVDGVNFGGGVGAEGLGGVDPVDRLRGVEGVPEHVLAPVVARPLQGQARDLPVVPAHAAAAPVQHREPVRGGVRHQVLAALHGVEEDELGPAQPPAAVEALHHGQKPPVVDVDRAVDRLVAPAAVVRRWVCIAVAVAVAVATVSVCVW